MWPVYRHRSQHAAVWGYPVAVAAGKNGEKGNKPQLSRRRFTQHKKSVLRFNIGAICSRKMLIYFPNEIHGSNFIKQHSETVMLRYYQNADCSLRKKNYCVVYVNTNLYSAEDREKESQASVARRVIVRRPRSVVARRAISGACRLLIRPHRCRARRRRANRAGRSM